MDTKGKLIVVSGFSGAGKGTIMKRLLSDYEDYELSISVTTRPPREGELEGKSYYFRSQDTFDKMIEQGYFIEYARYVGKSYGTPVDFVEQKMAEGKKVLLEIEIQGALQVKEKYPSAHLIFITPPDARTLVNRLIDRGSETSEVIRSRLARAIAEADGVDQYNDIVINDDLDICVKEVNQIILQNELHSVSYENVQKIHRIQEELRTILKGE